MKYQTFDTVKIDAAGLRKELKEGKLVLVLCGSRNPQTKVELMPTKWRNAQSVAGSSFLTTDGFFDFDSLYDVITEIRVYENLRDAAEVLNCGNNYYFVYDKQ
jgi:hypothetical protein